jgi:serine/threonine protein phosphatase 1
MNRRIVIGDIHGCYKTLKNLIELHVKPEKGDQLYFVGDLIDRGPRSREVLDYIIDLKWKGFNVFPIKGNHEDLFVKAFSDEEYMLAWFHNGAEETLQSFDVPEGKINDYEGLRLIPERYVHFLSSMPYYYDLKDYIIVHAGLNITGGNIFGDTQAMLWSREIKGLNLLKEGICIIHGHTPMPIVTLKPNLKRKDARNLNIDAGCVYKDLPGYGILAALELDSRKLFVQENVD